VRTYGYVPSLASRYVRALRTTGRLAEVGPAGDGVLELFPGFTDVVLEQAHAAHALGDADRARERFERCLELGDAGSRYSATVGAGSFFALGGLAQLAREAGDLEAAEALLRRALAEHDGWLGAVEPLAAVLLARGTPADRVAGEVLALLGDAPSPGARFILAVPLYEAGAVAEAEALLRDVLAAKPQAHQARVALAEALLSQGRLAEAAEEAAAVQADAPCAAAAARTATFSRLAAGEPTVVPDVLPAAERAAFEAWAAGGAAPAAVPAAAAGTIVVMLEALCKLRAFEAFEGLTRALDALALPWRERRELLAGVLLRRGFCDLAADQWLDVVERQGPDARALRGLAAVARERGMDEDAQVLLAEAEGLAA
jgi:tetratricopeptide (TPR) repeat protein